MTLNVDTAVCSEHGQVLSLTKYQSKCRMWWYLFFENIIQDNLIICFWGFFPHV